MLLFCQFSVLLFNNFSLIANFLLLFFYSILLYFDVCPKYFTTKYLNMFVYTVIFIIYICILFQLFVMSMVQYLHTNTYHTKILFCYMIFVSEFSVLFYSRI